MKHKKKIVVGLMALGLVLAALIGWSAHENLTPVEPKAATAERR